jgi:hypothetical protein
VVRITGIAFGWIGATAAFGGVVKNPYRYWDDAERDRLSGH